MSPPKTRSSGKIKTHETNHSGSPEQNALQTTGTMESLEELAEANHSGTLDQNALQTMSTMEPPEELAEANHSGPLDQNALQETDHILGTGGLADIIGSPLKDLPLPTLPSPNLDLIQETFPHDEDQENFENWSSKRILGKLVHNQFVILDRLAKIEKTLDEQTKRDNEFQPIQKELEQMKEFLQNSINTHINREGKNIPQPSQSATPNQESIHTLIETETREIGKQIWDNMSHERQKQTYEKWLQMKPPVIPKKYQPTNNPLETEIEREIRIEMAIERVKGDIRLYDIRIQKAQKRIEDIRKHVETEISKQPEDQRKEINLKWNSAIQQETDRAEQSWEKRESFLKNHSDNYQGPFKETKKKAQGKNGGPTHGQIGHRSREFFKQHPQHRSYSKEQNTRENPRQIQLAPEWGRHRQDRPRGHPIPNRERYYRDYPLPSPPADTNSTRGIYGANQQGKSWTQLRLDEEGNYHRYNPEGEHNINNPSPPTPENLPSIRSRLFDPFRPPQRPVFRKAMHQRNPT